MIQATDVANVLRKSLMAGETKFVFIKKDGSRRAAVGTLNLDEIPDADKQFKHTENEQTARTDQTAYYDLEKGGWRCCKFANVFEINGIKVEN